MLLINGNLWSNTETEKAIQLVSKQIVDTISNKSLDRQTVLDASGRFADDFLNGNLDMEFAPFLEHEELSRTEIQALVETFQKDALGKRTSRELDSLKQDNSIMILPKGVLFHIAAGNMDILPAYSVLEGLLTGNINILKLPSADHGLSVFLLQKLMEYEPRLKEYIYVFDTPSSDLVTVQKLMHLANTIVVWGSDDAIEAVRKNAPVNAEIVEWGHKLSFCYIQDMNIPDSLLLKLAHHLFETNQLLCNSCQGIYLDTDNFEDIAAFGKRFAKILGEIEKEYVLPDYLQGKLTLEALTRRLENTDQKEIIYQNQRSSVICKRDSDLELSMLYGNVWVKPLKPERIGAALHKSKLYLQTAGIYPLSTSLIQKLSRTGLTKITGIGEMSKKQLGMTHDGRFSLQQYVRLVEEIYELSGEEKHEREQ